MTKKIIKRKEILKWLKCNRFYPENGTLSQHVDEFYGSRKYHDSIGRYRQKPEDIRDYIIYGLEVFEEFLSICKKNRLVNDFIPTLLIYLNSGKKGFINYKLESLDDLIEDMSKYTTPPEIYLIKKIWNTNTLDDYFISYQKNIKSEFSKIFCRQFPNEYKIYYKAESYEYKYSKNGIIYTRAIYIQYNENNSEMVSNIRELKFK